MPTILIIAGPNGAGKTTFATEWFKQQDVQWTFLNADEIGREASFAGLSAKARELSAGRALLTRLDALIAQRADIALETTLSSGLYARRAAVWRKLGYKIRLIYLKLESVEASLRRVALRVANGGHGVPEADIRRRFGRSLANLEELYKPIVDRWEVWESQPGERILLKRSPQ